MCSWGDPPEVYVGKIRTARRNHRCEECTRTINAGERYHHAFMVYDKTPYTFRTCAHCRVGHQWLIQNCHTFAHAELHDDMAEHAKEYPSIKFGLLRIQAGIRRQWERFDDQGLMKLPAMPRPIADAVLEAV